MAEIAVAPFVGAWIETRSSVVLCASGMSLPSWERGLKLVLIAIPWEMRTSLPSWERGLKRETSTIYYHKKTVAPFVGAWIETQSSVVLSASTTSLPSWERGLKQSRQNDKKRRYRSLPSWERGLKLFPVRPRYGEGEVAPFVGAWIETAGRSGKNSSPSPSLPSWERGLKRMG